ncbi:MAG: hypothetical protein ABFD84_13670, partial [Candidatus Polarisedimenticolia bacterium]
GGRCIAPPPVVLSMHSNDAIAEALLDGLRAIAAPVVWRRGDARINVDLAGPCEPEYNVDLDAKISHLDKDWLLPADALLFAGRLDTPRSGDRIDTEDGQTYEVLPYGKEECYQPIGTPPVLFRVHTKQIKP